VKTRQTTIQAFAGHLLPGTDVYPIHVKDPISRIVMPYSVLIPATARLQHMSQVFTRINIVDGSDVLLSLRGEQIDGIAKMRALAADATFESNNPSITVWGNLVIDFGRYLYDKEIALEPARFKNPQIQVTHNAATIAATGVRCDYSILADIMEGLTSGVRGFLMKKEIKSWVGVVGGWEYTQLARDFPYRAIWLQALTKMCAMDTHWSRALLNEDSYARVPFDALIDDQIADNAADFGEINEHVAGIANGGAAPVFAAPAYSGSCLIHNQTGPVAIGSIDNDGGQYSVLSATNTDLYRGMVHGLCPQGLVVFNLGPKDNIEDWYDPTVVGSLQLEVLGTGARTMRLITEQLRPNEPR
jgi:hypothetical protein